MNNYMKTIISGLKQWVSSQKSDWNQNDSSAVNFIKNRPFYSEEKEKVLFSGNIPVENFQDNFYGVEELAYGLSFVVGQIYKVTFDNVEYLCECKLFENGVVFLGNLMIMGQGEETGEPFLIIQPDSSVFFLYCLTEGTHSLSISGTVEEIHQIDRKYIPIPKLADVAFSGDYHDLWNVPSIYWDVVRYNVYQSLSDNDKERARNNIGAASQSNVNSLSNKEYLIRSKTDGSTVRYVVDITTAKAKSKIYENDYSQHEDISVPLCATSTGLFYSLNGKDWLRVPNSTDCDFTQSFSCVCSYDNVSYAVVSNSNILYKNTFDITKSSYWEKITLPTSQKWSKITQYYNRIMLVADNSNIGAYSADSGTTWSSITLPEAADWIDLQYYYDNGTIFYLAAGSKIFITKDEGQSWETINLTISPYTLFLDKKVFIASGYSHTIYSMDKGVTWNVSTMTNYYLNFDHLGWLNDTSLFGIGYDGGQSEYIYRSDDFGKTWYKLSYLPGDYNKHSIVQDIYGYKIGYIDLRPSNRKPMWFSNNGIDWVDELILLKDEVKMSLHKGIKSLIPANPLDETLSTKGASADAKATGNAIAALKTPATTSTDGLMSSSDKAKLDNTVQNLKDGKTVGSMRSVNADAETDTYSLGRSSVALGEGTSASGSYSFAAGNGAKASGLCSHAEGSAVTAASECQYVQGKNNVIDSNGKYLHIVGNGSDTTASNAHTLDWDGNAWFAGNIYIGGTSQDDATAVKVAIVPFPTASDEGKILRVVNGAPTWVSIQDAEGGSF